MNNNDYKEKLKMKIAMYNAVEDIEQNSKKYLTKNNKRKGWIFIKKKIIATACASLVLVSGIVVATSIKSKKIQDRGLGGGINTAVENGYIAEPSSAFITSKDMGVDVILQDFLMDDMNLSLNFSFNFNDKLNEKIDIDKMYKIELKDLIIQDDKNRIIYAGIDEDRFNSYCIENGLNYKINEYSDNYINSGVDSFISSKESNNIDIMYNIYSDGFPQSKKLYFSFTKILINEWKDDKFIESNEYIIDGNWEISVDVPEEMYNRTYEYYKVVKCDNPDFDVYLARLTDTGFEFGVIISNIEKPKFDSIESTKAAKADQDYVEGKITEEEYDKLREYYLDELYLKDPISTSHYVYKGRQLEVSFVENEKSEKFEPTFVPGRRASYKFLEGNKYDFCETFSMTKYNETDKIKVILYYYEDIVTIELEKVKPNI